MAVGTSKDYIDRLREQKVNAFMNGKKIDNFVDDPRIRVGINAISTTFDAAHNPDLRDLVTLESPLIGGEKINRWTHILENAQDAIAKARAMREVGGEYGCPCVYRCIGNDMINTAWAVSYEIDKKHGTNYHKNVIETVKQIQKKDLVLGGTIIDPKGDRSLRPGEQPDPDVYLHVVEKRDDGIIVRGGKAHSTAALYTDMLCAVPSYPLRENEKEFAVGFFCPLDADGITFMCRPATAPTEEKKLENPVSKKYGHAEIFVIYDNVFIPWERVFMCGEYEFCGFLMNTFTGFHMLSKCGCRSASMEMDIGATALIAEANGIKKASHINNYINEMIMNTEMVYACSMAAAVNGRKHESGVFIPDLVPASAGKVFAAKKLGEHRFFMQDSAGGLVQTMVNEKDFLNPQTGKLMEKYYKVKEKIPTENRVRAFKLVEDLTSSLHAGWYHAMCVTGGGGPEMLKQGIRVNYDTDKFKKRAKKMAGIE
ncbi:MAG: 4-hydroxyphenylacetate 3-hydroxylase N-terminal domain-containing protein [Desulfobacterales bacterium]